MNGYWSFTAAAWHEIPLTGDVCYPSPLGSPRLTLICLRPRFSHYVLLLPIRVLRSVSIPTLTVRRTRLTQQVKWASCFWLYLLEVFLFPHFVKFLLVGVVFHRSPMCPRLWRSATGSFTESSTTLTSSKRNSASVSPLRCPPTTTIPTVLLMQTSSSHHRLEFWLWSQLLLVTLFYLHFGSSAVY